MRNRMFAALFILLVLSWTAAAVTPQFWENFTQDDLLEGRLDRISLTPEGKIFVSREYEMVFDTGQPYIFSMVRDSRGNLYIGTGDDGRVYRIDPQGKGTLFFKAEEINVFALAVDSSDRLYVGTSPDGKVYKVTGPSQAEEFFDTDEKYIWSMVFDHEDNLYVGTGPGGVIYKVGPDGGKDVFYQCGDTHVRCLAHGEDGNLLAGTSPSGLVLEITPEGKAFTLTDTPMEEVHTIVSGPFGTVYAVASSSAGTGAKSSSGTESATGDADSTSGSTMLIESIMEPRNPGSARTVVSAPGNGDASAGTRSVVYAISKGGGVETVYVSKTQMIFDAAVQDDGSLLLATGPKGRIVSIDSARQISVITDSTEEQLTQLLANGDTVYAGSSNQGKVFALRPKRAREGIYESKILDAQSVASWGKIFWNVTNPKGANFKFSTRTGNTDKIDGSWSDWSSSYSVSGKQITSPNARYLQWRVSIDQGSLSAKDSPADLLDQIRISYLQQNLRPQVEEIEVLPYGIEFQRQPALTVSSASLVVRTKTQNGQSLNSPRERGKGTPVPPPRQVLQPGAQSFTWDATDENQDTLEYSLYFKGESESDWKLLEDKYTDTFYTLDADSLPDGTYRLKVVASDAPSNPSDGFLVNELVSRPFVIANTPPKVAIGKNDVKEKKVQASFEACVSAGSVATAEFSIDGGDWHLVFPDDGIADSECEAYKITTPALTVGEHLVSVRASDREGNTGISKIIVRIP